jgi:hypothetical protein
MGGKFGAMYRKGRTQGRYHDYNQLAELELYTREGSKLCGDKEEWREEGVYVGE